MRTKSRGFDFFWPLAALFSMMAVLLIAIVLVLVRQFDEAVLVREQAVVEHGVEARIAEVAHKAVPQTLWDEAVRNLDNRFDPAWAEENIGEYFRQIDGFEASFVLDAADRPIYAADAEGTARPSHFSGFASEAAPLVAAVRAAEARRGPLTPAARASEMLTAPIQASGIAPVGGSLHLIVATLVQPDFGRAMPGGPRAPIVVTGMALDKEFIDSFGSRFLLDGLHLHKLAPTAREGEARASLRAFDGRQVGTLDWFPETPGAVLLSNVILPILVVMSGLGVAALILFRYGRRATQGLIASEARASHLAYHDALTGLPNRVLFFDRLGHALDQARRSGAVLAVHLIDLDRFKDVNDTFGHHVGDELIREAAHRLAAQCRTSDTFARLSGDEFAIVQTDATASSAAALAARLVEAMGRPVDLPAGRVFVGCSVGVALVAKGEMDAPEAMRHADLALYRAKGDGKARYCFFEIEMDAAVKTRRALEADLREALKRGELELAYQPQVNRRGGIIGVESLLRWRHPERGPVSPAFFVRVAEECGLINDLGTFALRRAFEDSRRWPHLKVAVNVSAPQLRSPDFVAHIANLAAEAQVDPRNFELEITEGVLLGDDPATHETLKRLRQMGFGLALDDFGTGYSSLSYLRNYPVNKIKIDRSFITNLGIDAEAEAVISAIVKLARALNLEVIAEGVETSDQRERLNAAGCAEIQGFLFSHPVNAERIDEMWQGGVLTPAG